MVRFWLSSFQLWFVAANTYNHPVTGWTGFWRVPRYLPLPVRFVFFARHLVPFGYSGCAARTLLGSSSDFAFAFLCLPPQNTELYLRAPHYRWLDCYRLTATPVFPS